MIVIKYGGSIINPNKTYNKKAIQKVRDIIQTYPKQSFCFVIGGGKICRNAQSACTPHLTALLPKSQIKNALDEIGIATTKINANYILTYLKKQGVQDLCPDIIINNKPPKGYRIYIVAGYRPGHTTDVDVMEIAKHAKAMVAIKISNFPVVLDVKPHHFRKEDLASYEKLPFLTWQRLKDLVGDEYVAGGSYPLDPVATKMGYKLGKKCFELYIGQYQELDNMIKNKKFEGTIVKN